MIEQEAPLVQNINLGEQPETMPPQPKEEVKTEKQWKDQTQMGLRLTEPFSASDVMAGTGTTIGGAQSQIRRWIYWGWVKNVSYGKYVRSPTFGGVKGNVGYNPTRRKPTEQARRHLKGQGKVQLHCDVPGCDYIVYAVDERNAKGAIGRHKTREHGFKRKYVRKEERGRLGYSRKTREVVVAPSNGTPAPVAAPELESLPFCPHCGHNILMHVTAYRIARKHRRE